MGSDRGFGAVFAVVFGLAGLLPMLSGREPRLWALGMAVLVAICALIKPSLLRPFNGVWFAFGQALHHVVTPVVMGLLFFLVVTPVGIAMRLSGKDPMHRKRDPGAASYWSARCPPGPGPGSMKHQF